MKKQQQQKKKNWRIRLHATGKDSGNRVKPPGPKISHDHSLNLDTHLLYYLGIETNQTVSHWLTKLTMTGGIPN